MNHFHMEYSGLKLSDEEQKKFFEKYVGKTPEQRKNILETLQENND